MDFSFIRCIFAAMKLLADTGIIISNILEAFGPLDTVVGSLPVCEMDLSEIDASLQELALCIQESVSLVKGFQHFRLESLELVLLPCIEGRPSVQTILIMTIHYHSDLWVNNSKQYNISNYSTQNQLIWI